MSERDYIFTPVPDQFGPSPDSLRAELERKMSLLSGWKLNHNFRYLKTDVFNSWRDRPLMPGEPVCLQTETGDMQMLLKISPPRDITRVHTNRTRRKFIIFGAREETEVVREVEHLPATKEITLRGFFTTPHRERLEYVYNLVMPQGQPEKFSASIKQYGRPASEKKLGGIDLQPAPLTVLAHFNHFLDRSVRNILSGEAKLVA